MNTKLIFTLPGLILFALAACSDKNSDNIIGYEGTTEENNANNSTGSSSSEVNVITFNLWDGTKSEYTIKTGLDNGSNTSGYWYILTDNNDGGASSLTFPIKILNDSYDDGLSVVIDECSGMCGSVSLDSGSTNSRAFAGMAFNIAGIDDDGNATLADVSDWGGICVAYTSEEDISIIMGMDDKTNQSINNDLPMVALPKALKRNELCLPWKDFKQSNSKSISGEEAAKKLATLIFVIYGKSGTEAKFNIMALGSYSASKTSEYSVSSSSVNPQSNSSKDVQFDMWNPKELEYQVNTGLDNGTGTSGYWFTFEDNYDGGLSRISLPIESAIEVSEDPMEPIIEVYGGLNGTAILEKGSRETTPFAGVSFNVAGIEDKDDNAESADASAWGGVCFAYESESDFRVEMGPAGHPDNQSKQDLPGKYVQASLEETEVCIPWSDFKQKEGNEINGEQAAKQLASIRFTFYGDDGTTAKFNIKGFGSYNCAK